MLEESLEELLLRWGITQELGFSYKLAKSIKDYFKEKLNDKIVLTGHIEKESDFWVVVHLPNSGTMLDFMKRDIVDMRKAIEEE